MLRDAVWSERTRDDGVRIVTVQKAPPPAPEPTWFQRLLALVFAR